MSSSEEDNFDPRAAKSTQSTMKSLFASDSRTAAANSTSLKYEAKSKKDDVSSGAAAQAVGQQPPSANGGGTITAAQAAVQAFRGEVSAGTAVVATVIVSNIPMVLLIDRERKPLARVRCQADLQLLQNQSSPIYATLFDPAIGQHWTLMFKSELDCRNYIVATQTLLHYVQLADGPVEPFIDFAAPSEGGARGQTCKKGDKVVVSLTMWLLHRLGGFGSALFSTGKIVEEIPSDAPRSVVVGQGTMMAGVEDTLVGMGPGSKRLTFLSPRKTKILSGGLANPEIGASDSVVVLVTVHSVGKGGGGNGVFDIGGDSASNDSDGPATSRGGGRRKGAATRGGAGGSDDDLFSKKQSSKTRRSIRGAEESPQPAQPQQPQAITAGPPPLASAPAPISPPPAGGFDQNTLLQTMLLQTLQMQNQQQQQQRHEPVPPAPSAAAFDIDRGLDRIYQQLFSLSEKLDRLDVEGKIAKNNATLERMVKKAVGKMPTNDVDVEDMAKDRDQLLAKIEHLKHRVEEATDNYHKALETMGNHKDQVSALRNDLAIERETAAARIKELTERKRLELVDAEVRHRRELDVAKEQAHQAGLDEGLQRGLAAGKLEALQLTGTSTAEGFKIKEQELQHQLLDAERQTQNLAIKHNQERRELLEQIDSLNSLIKRLEARETTNAVSVVDTSSAMCKTLRRAMNSTYASVESQFYAMERETVSVEDALAMVLLSIKSETRTFVDEIKREGALIASAAATNQGRARRMAEQEATEGGDANAESVAAYKAGGIYAEPSNEKSGAAMDEYHAMRAEIEAHQAQRLAEARAEELRSSSAVDGDGSQPALGSNSEKNDLNDEGHLDINALPLPPLFDDDEDHAPPPPPEVHQQWGDVDDARRISDDEDDIEVED